MPTPEQLAGEYAQYSDEYLVDYLKRGVLTEVAAQVARRELSTRGVDLERRLAEPEPVAPPSWIARCTAATEVRATLARIARFPLRAVLALEPFWVVLIAGGAIDWLVRRLMIRGTGLLLVLDPLPAYALPLGYGALAIRMLVAAWFVIALWRSAARLRSPILRVAGVGFAILCAISSVRFMIRGADAVHLFLAPPAASVMDTDSIRR